MTGSNRGYPRNVNPQESLRASVITPNWLRGLRWIAMNLRWSWHAPTRDLFEFLDPDLWREVEENPIAWLRALDASRVRRIDAREDTSDRIAAAFADLRAYLTASTWYDSPEGPGEDRPVAIAYFSPEYGITAVLPQYSGGLGILAGDHLKSASDLGVPIIGVGLLYGAGYFRQALSQEGSQMESYPELDFATVPLVLLRRRDGSPVEVSIDLPGDKTMYAAIWRADVGRVPLLLLDTDVPKNSEDLRSVTDRLYGGDAELRLRQELLLGVGGVRALREFSGLTKAPGPTVVHMNEGHAGFAGIERIREHLVAGLSFEEALEKVRQGTIFTTHTPVPAGIDRFAPELIATYFSIPAWGVPGLSPSDSGAPHTTPGYLSACAEKVLALGAETEDWPEPRGFNMALMGLRLAGQANGVSKLHGEVSRHMFHALWPEREEKDVPIGSITNGVHAPTWEDRRLAEIEATRLEGDPEAWLGTKVSDEELWGLLTDQRVQFVDAARRRLHASLLERGFAPDSLDWIDTVFDRDVLTIAFARRVPSYKRLTLMLRDPERLLRLLTRDEQSIQIVVAGKAHPNDEGGKGLIKGLVEFADREDVRRHMVFLPNYDMALVTELLPGCDVWLNNPLRPYEACGTSGMKAALNGALNLSTRDGWWDEWSDGENGWDILTADGAATQEERDDQEAASLYEILEEKVIPLFYDRANGIPVEWLNRVRHTFATLGPKVQATRMVREYTESLYMPAARLVAGTLSP